MMGNPRCHWVRDRLPLLVGDELRGLDRRRVERHLIGCPQCREHQAALGQALDTLRTVAATTLAEPDAPSLWPALARQIRESRRPSPTPSFTLPLLTFWLRRNPWPALSLGLALTIAATVSFSLRQQMATAQAQILVSERPIKSTVAPPKPARFTTPAADPDRDRLAPAEPPIAENTPPPPRFDFDSSLEHGHPMPPIPDRGEVRDTKATY